MALHSRRDARTDLLHGTIDMIILRTLRWGPQHTELVNAIGRVMRPAPEAATEE
jgi:hypothetical protein